ncbi:efflux RND transporter permease subunit [Methanoplanus limicola]|uniref:Efflux transporter, hydrophobe/amphiphile efflux-3 (HAE3) family n=1 Tax=Methanoplanus limicola DSM 2279 TaxID=937775 RepID=H1Z360_9EURY|nr:hydrophobe/amphiphile efflux-3 (HAE3) family transporter [Methanoplanus limicola]EHQ35600.1 efflux transporter, hydrophobe/amphiphile efflux-3 (HAE3) family [Methanoplanus limicola DSM 2279]
MSGLNEAYRKTGEIINRHPKTILLLLVVLFICAGYFTTYIKSQNMSDQYLDKSTPKGIIYDQYNDNFVSDTYILLIQTANPADYELLKDLLILEEQINRLDYIKSSTSIADIVSEMNGGVLPDNNKDINELISLLPEKDSGMFIPDSETAIAYIEVEQGISTDISATILPGVQSIVDTAVLPPGVYIEVTGGTPYNVEMQTAMVENGIVLVLGAFALMFVVLGILFSNMRHWYLPIVLLLVSLIYTFGFMGAFNIPFNNGAVAALPILLGLGIDYAVQFHARFDEERRKDQSIHDSVLETVSNTGPAVLLAMLATTMGFIAMILTPIPMIQSFGIVAIIGVACSYLTALFGFPAIASVMSYEPKYDNSGPAHRIMSAYDHVLGRLSKKIVRVSVPILIIAVSVAYIGVVTDSTIAIDTSTKDMAPPDLPAQLSLDKVQDVAGSVTAFPYYIKGDELTNIEVIQWIDRFGSFAEDNHEEITGVDSIATIIRKYNNNEIPDDQGTLNYILEEIPDDKKNPYLQGPDEAVVSFSTVSLSMDEESELKAAVSADITWLNPPAGIELFPTGDFDLYTALISQIAESKDQMTITGFILIFLFLLFAYRKLVAATPVVPIICIVGWNTVAMLILGMEYNPISACLGSMTIGVASEYTILVMERYIEEYEKSGDKTEAIITAVKKIGSAITVSGLVTASGFSALMLSAFPIIGTFGLSTVIAVGFSLIGAIFIMPAILTFYAGTENIIKKESKSSL